MIYIYCGTDRVTINEKIELLLNMQNLRSVSFNSVEGICTHIYQNALISQNLALIARYDDAFLKADESWQSFVDNCNNQTVILVYETLDKRSTFYKFFQRCIIEFNEEDDKIVFQYANAFCLHNRVETVKIAECIPESEVIFALSVTYNKLRKILQIQTTPKGVKIQANTGINYYEQQSLKKYIGVFNTENLIYLLRLISGCIERIKTGQFDNYEALWYNTINGG